MSFTKEKKLLNNPSAIKGNVTRKKIMKHLNKCDQGELIKICYRTVRPADIATKLTIEATKLTKMSLADLANVSKMSVVLAEAALKLHSDARCEFYQVRKKNEKVETNDSGYMLFDSDDGIKSILLTNITSIVIRGVKLERW